MTEIPKPIADVFGAARRLLRKFEDRREVGDGHIKASWTLTVVTEEDELDGGYTAWIDEFPGCISDGDTEDEAVENVMEAFRGVLAFQATQAPVNHTTIDDTKVTTRHVAMI